MDNNGLGGAVEVSYCSPIRALRSAQYILSSKLLFHRQLKKTSLIEQSSDHFIVYKS